MEPTQAVADDGHAGGGSSSSASFCPHSLCPASQRPLRWRRSGVGTDGVRGVRVLLRGNVAARRRAARGRAHHRRGQRLRGRGRDRCRRPWAIGVPEKGEYKRHPRRGHPPRGRRRRRGRTRPRNVPSSASPSRKAVQLLPRRGRRARRRAIIDQVLDRVINGLNFGLLLALAAIGLSLIFGTTGLSQLRARGDGHLRRPHDAAPSAWTWRCRSGSRSSSRWC